MTDQAKKAPDDLVDVSPGGYIAIESTQPKNVVQAAAPPEDLIDVDPDYVSRQVNPYNTVTGVATGAAAVSPLIEEKLFGTDLRNRRSLETYLRSQIHHKYPSLDLASLEKEVQKVTHPKNRVATMHEVQDALRTMEGRGYPGVGPVDLSTYEKAKKPTTTAGKIAQPIKKTGEFVEALNPFLGQGYGSKAFRTVGRAGLGFGAAYEGAEAYNKALEGDYSGATGSASTSAGLGLLAVPNPYAKGVGAVLAGVPFASNFVGNANAAPMTKEEASGMAFDIGTGLLGPVGMALSPSQLGHGTLRKRDEPRRPGESVLKGSTLPPQGYAEGKSVKGGESNAAPFIGYPHIKNKPRDPNFVQQSGPILGGLDAVIGMGKRDDVSVLTPEGRAYNESYDKYEPVGIAASILPFMGGPAKAVGKSAAKNLGPRAADMAENYLAKIGGVQYAVPPGGQSTFAQRVLAEPTPAEIAQFKAKPTKDVKYSDAIQNHLGEYLGLHMSDPYGVHGGRKGGTGFGNFQNINPLHAKNEVVWMNDSKEAANKLTGSQMFNNKPIVWSNYIGSPTQHISNKSVANEILEDIYKSHPNMSSEMAERTNELLLKKFGVTGVDIRDKDAMKEILNKSFDARKQFGNIAEGFGAGKGKIVLSPNWKNILDTNRDPFIAGANTSEIGTRLSRIHNEPSQFSTAFHPDYRWTVHGKDLGVRFPSVPQSIAVPDWYNEYRSRNFSKNGKPLDPHGNAWFGYMKTPQFISEPYIKAVQAAGYAPGGKVLGAAKKLFNDAQAAYKAKFTPGFYHGSNANNIKAFDPLKNTDPMKLETPGVTFVTRDPDFAESFLPGSNRGGYKTGATMYPVNVNLGKHWDPSTPEGKKSVQDYVNKMYPHEKNPADLLHVQKQMLRGNWIDIENPNFLNHLRETGHDTFHVMEGGIPNVGVFKPENIRGKFAKFNPEDAESPDFMKAEGGSVQHFQAGKKVIQGGLNQIAKFARHPHGQDPKVAQALEEYLKGNISQEERIRIANQFLPIRQWNELPPNYTDDEIRNALTSNKQAKALAPVPVGMRVGNRLDIPAYTQKGVYVDTTHDAAGKPISYGRTGHLKDVEFYSSPDTFVRVGLGTKPQALTPMGAVMGTDKTPKAQIKGIHQGTKDDEVRRMMEEMMRDPAYTQIGMDPRKHSQFYDKQTGMPVFSAEEKLQSGPLILAPKKGLETTSWDDPRLNLSDFPGKKYKKGGKVRK
jgi:hypothetical protein